MKPIAAKERIHVIDVIRGFALFGVIVINVFFINMPPYGFIDMYHPVSVTDHVSYWFIKLLIVGKFISLFSFLFGLGFAIQIFRLKEKGISARFYFRRLLILVFIGLFHSLVIWEGDILLSYAVFAMLLLLMHKFSARFYLILLSVIILYHFGEAVSPLLKKSNPGIKQEAVNKEADRTELEKRMKIREDFFNTFRKGSYPEVTKERIKMTFSKGKIRMIYGEFFHIFPLFLIGAYIGKRRIFHNMEKHIPFIKKVLLWSLLSGVGIEFLKQAIESKSNISVTGNLVYFFGNISSYAICFFYVSILVLAFRKKFWQKVLNPLRYTGRMALTNYLLQSFCFGLIFYKYGLGLNGQKSITFLFVLALLLYIIEIYASSIWLRKFQYGPAEWLWRTLTYKTSLSFRQ